jgi:hypothetical protein
MVVIITTHHEIINTITTSPLRAGFLTPEPRRGYAYAQAAGTDTPIFWDVEFKFTRAEAVRFMLTRGEDYCRVI